MYGRRGYPCAGERPLPIGLVSQGAGCAELASSYWIILSAEYGLVHQDEMIEPYEMTLDAMGVAERRNWSRRVQQQMDERMPDARRIVVLAGQRYREFLMEYLRSRAATVHVPLAGMRNGPQLSWLGKHAGDGPVQWYPIGC